MNMVGAKDLVPLKCKTGGSDRGEMGEPLQGWFAKQVGQPDEIFPLPFLVGSE